MYMLHENVRTENSRRSKISEQTKETKKILKRKSVLLPRVGTNVGMHQLGMFVQFFFWICVKRNKIIQGIYFSLRIFGFASIKCCKTQMN